MYKRKENQYKKLKYEFEQLMFNIGINAYLYKNNEVYIVYVYNKNSTADAYDAYKLSIEKNDTAFDIKERFKITHPEVFL